jgi:uncharacterized protein (TIGR00296 family)
MATQAHCAYCFETLAATLEKRQSLSLPDVEHLWAKYNIDPTTTSELEDETEEEEAASLSPKPAAISRLLASPPSSGSSSSLQSGVSTPATSLSSSSTNLVDGKEEEHPLFVTWNTVTSRGEKRLRGCIGTFEAQPLSTGLSSYALTSALQDTRFSPITARELPTLECAVTLLTNFEPAADAMDWDIGTHGIRISFAEKGRRYGSTYLPDVAKEQGWSKEEALVSLMRKAGWKGKDREWEGVDVRVTRYQGKKISLGWGEWKEWRDWVEEEMDEQ